MVVYRIPPWLALTVLIVFVVPGAWSQEPTKKLSPPDTESVNAALKLVNEVYKHDYVKASTQEQKALLAARLLKDGIATVKDSTGRYVLLRTAKDLAAQQGDIDTALQAIEQMGMSFNVDVLGLKADAVIAATKLSRTPMQYAKANQLYASLIDEFIAADRFDRAKECGELALSLARRGERLDLTKTIVIRNKRTEVMATEYEKLKPALSMIEARPTDRPANLAVGKFRCFTKGEWRIGIPYLALGDDESLSSLGARELSQDPDELTLADGWWDYAANLNESTKSRVHAHAAEWYQKALPAQSGLDRRRVETRLSQIDKWYRLDLK